MSRDGARLAPALVLAAVVIVGRGGRESSRPLGPVAPTR